MTRSNRKKTTKEWKNWSKNWEMNVLISKNTTKKKSIHLNFNFGTNNITYHPFLRYLRSTSYNPWDRDVYKGFERMCNEEWIWFARHPHIGSMAILFSGIHFFCTRCCRQMQLFYILSWDSSHSLFPCVPYSMMIKWNGKMLPLFAGKSMVEIMKLCTTTITSS